MNNKEKQLYTLIVTNPGRLGALMEADSMDEQIDLIHAFGKENDIPVSREQVGQFLSILNGRELSDQELEAVAGGKLVHDRDENPFYISYNENFLSGSSGDDSMVSMGWCEMSGGAGNDTMEGGNDSDTMYGGSGNDVMTGDTTHTVVGYTEDGIRISFTTNAEDGGGDYMDGGAGNDWMDGATGDDTMLGGSGNDTMKGGTGNDTMYGGADGDFMDGGEGDDSMRGGSGSDWMAGGAGDDSMYGGTGDDLLLGDIGNDVLGGGQGNDRLIAGDGDDKLFGGSGNDTLYGEAGNDTLSGGSGDDRLDGGEGDDLLRGGTGDDLLTGGSGNDVFVFGRGDGNDTITDFDSSEDRLKLIGNPGQGDINVTTQDGNTIITYGDTTITLEGTEMSAEEVWNNINQN
ncbi:calcium-binding protein [Desulfovibrio ferrophilus]|uniref:RTX toxins and related Ca2+-binding protein n=1 Tax=Desulfovibrio ferrophilus TaxID=241368 RepID=A0A2Z6AYD2_9BACT|nr:calcium-binding protein [Desulfovibrio ferrophilus]BBD08228.1 RTX toxins and related Ca2+-binding protein [Desulfovibrio ferrophilus]